MHSRFGIPFPHRELTPNKKNNFQFYRLSRAMSYVEFSFGKLAHMWRILFRQMDEQPESAIDVVKAITVLDKFISMQEPERSTVTNRVDPAETKPDTPMHGKKITRKQGLKECDANSRNI
ncbi:hypothetical protein ElyMa_002177500 [Elysia marginata]|uniref:DDE Tnp4 domain-containing protein n=1 Tax=Elysia marginata TaxID=1093978 RepID=A0AAV4FQN6_9GAST|nr:hypothetical protein ElyMa_002177500 [Elysia marginata]